MKKMMRIPQVQFLFKKEKEKYQIYIYDDIQESGEFDWKNWKYKESETSAKYFQRELEKIPEGSEIEIFINSNGGSVKEGTAIYNQLKRHKSYKTGYVDGVAHSIAFVILQACDRRIMGEGTSALLHEMWVCTCGNAEELRKEADQLDDLMEASRKLFMQRAKNITEEELADLMHKETMLTPDKALEYGFIDEIAERKDPEENPEEDPEENPEEDPEENPEKNIKQLKQKMQNKNFAKELKEFKRLSRKTSQKKTSEGKDMMTNFFAAFS